MSKNTSWHYAEPNIDQILTQPILSGFEGIRPGDHLMLAGGSSGRRIARVVSNTPAGRGNGIMELRTVWTANPDYDVSRAATNTSQWKSLTNNGARFYVPVAKTVPKPEPAPKPAPKPATAPTGQLQLPATSAPAPGTPGTLAALNCIHSAVLEGTKKAEEIAKQTYTNVGEIADLQADTNRLLQELLNEIKGLRAIWEGK